MTSTPYQFTAEDRSKGGKRGSEVLRQKREELDRRSLVAWRIVDEVNDLAPATLATVLALVERAASQIDELDISDPLALQRVAQSAEILHRISRLASGQSTANVAHASLTDEERRERLARLAAGDTSAVGDTPPSSPDA